jgi:23S rRNA (cytosine1962-C5)-methyltransferase
MKKNPIIVLKPKREETLSRFHLWVFSGAIDRIEGTPKEGDVVDVVDSLGRLVAKGHYQIGSIAVRILSFDKNETIDEKFWLHKINLAYTIRKSLGLVAGDKNNAYRLIHGEGDGLPGLVIDIYADTAVMQAHSVGMHYAKEFIADSLMQVVEGLKNVYYKSEGTLPYKASVNNENCYLVGNCPEACVAIENGLKFHVNGYKYAGGVIVKYNEYTDLFDVEFTATKKIIEDIYADNLVSTIDYHVEYSEQYKEQVKQTYNLK